MIVRFSTSDNPDLKAKAYRDLKWIGIVAATSLALAVYFDALDMFVHWYITKKEPYELEEIIPVFLVLPFALAFLFLAQVAGSSLRNKKTKAGRGDAARGKR
jgi:hypothetical protein